LFVDVLARTLLATDRLAAGLTGAASAGETDSDATAAAARNLFNMRKLLR
jgi:hypothetical protein